MTATEARPVVLHTTWHGRLQQAGAPLILLGVAAAGFVRAGEARPVPLVLAVVGAAVLVTQLLDFPIVTVFGADGVQRRCVLRRQVLSWDDIGAIARPGTILGGGSARLRSFAGAEGPTATRQGLVAEVGERRRRYLLTDHVEGRAEYDAIERGLRIWSPSTPLRASRPPEGTAPTFVYKRRRGVPDSLPVDRLP